MASLMLQHIYYCCVNNPNTWTLLVSYHTAEKSVIISTQLHWTWWPCHPWSDGSGRDLLVYAVIFLLSGHLCRETTLPSPRRRHEMPPLPLAAGRGGSWSAWVTQASVTVTTRHSHCQPLQGKTTDTHSYWVPVPSNATVYSPWN